MDRGPSEDIHLGPYELLLELASGAMATVFIARHVGAAGFERLVVIKRIHRHLLKNHEFCDMFRDEARVSSRLHHPNIVSALDVVEADGRLFLVLEYVESISLRELVRAAAERGSLLEPGVLVRIFADVLAGLDAAHDARDLTGERLEVIHRDVSPQNIIVGLDGMSRLIDFGIAKAAARLTTTKSGVLKGKLSYMSPEQVKQRSLDRRADIFAAGVVLHEALTGQKLFRGEDEGDIALAILFGDVPAPSSIVPGLSSELDGVVLKALARDREDRFRTAAEFQSALEAAWPPASGRDVTARVDGYAGEVFKARRDSLRAAVEGRPDPFVNGAPGSLATGVSKDLHTDVDPIATQPTRTQRVVRAGALAGALFGAVVAGAWGIERSWSGSGREASATPVPNAANVAQEIAPSAPISEVPEGGRAASVEPQAIHDASLKIQGHAQGSGAKAVSPRPPSGASFRSSPSATVPSKLRGNPYGPP